MCQTLLIIGPCLHEWMCYRLEKIFDGGGCQRMKIQWAEQFKVHLEDVCEEIISIRTDNPHDLIYNFHPLLQGYDWMRHVSAFVAYERILKYMNCDFGFNGNYHEWLRQQSLMNVWYILEKLCHNVCIRHNASMKKGEEMLNHDLVSNLLKYHAQLMTNVDDSEIVWKPTYRPNLVEVSLRDGTVVFDEDQKTESETLLCFFGDVASMFRGNTKRRRYDADNMTWPSQATETPTEVALKDLNTYDEVVKFVESTTVDETTPQRDVGMQKKNMRVWRNKFAEEQKSGDHIEYYDTLAWWQHGVSFIQSASRVINRYADSLYSKREKVQKLLNFLSSTKTMETLMIWMIFVKI